MISAVTLPTASTARPSRHSQDVAVIRHQSSTIRSQVDNEILDPVQSSLDLLAGDIPHFTAPRRPSSLNHLAHEDVLSPFFLSKANHLGLILISIVLNGANY
uniref:Uncharacterized protein n=1 Tax=Cannabis sativa TaxID=3483 RepID=A0A803NS41_CANSA